MRKSPAFVKTSAGKQGYGRQANPKIMRHHIRWIPAFLAIAVVAGVSVQLLPKSFRAALFEINPAVTNPTTGVFISRAYEAKPNERGSVMLEAGETLRALEGIRLTFAVDPTRASIVRVRRTAVTQNFAISLDFPGPGVARVALAGRMRDVSEGLDLLEFELQLKDNTMNVNGGRIELRLLNVAALTENDRIVTAAHDGLIAITTNQNALSVPFTPHIADIDPGTVSLVSRKAIVIRGKNFPASPRVLLGNRPIPVLFFSSTEVVAGVPEDMPQGAYAVSLDSILADEEVVILDAPGPSGRVDILDEMMFISPNPVLSNAEQSGTEIVLWVPVFNPLGSDDPVIGSVDFSAIGGDPNVVFEGTGDPAVGAGGRTVNWFRVPEEGAMTLPETLQTNSDYPVTARVENRALSRDEAIEVLEVRSKISRGSAPSFGPVETVPATVLPGTKVTFFADVTDSDGISTVQIVSLRLTQVGGGLLELTPALAVPSGGAPLQTATFTADFTVPKSAAPQVYALELRAADENGNEARTTFDFTISAPLPGQAAGMPTIVRSFASPQAVPADGETESIFVVEIEDTDGVGDIAIARINLTPLRLGIVPLSLDSGVSAEGGTRGIFTSGGIRVQKTVAAGAYNPEVEVEDKQGNRVRGTIAFAVGGVAAPGGDAPAFRDVRFVPETVEPGGEVRLFAEVTDGNGTEDVTVIADFTELQLDVEELDDLIDFPSGTLITQNTFSSDRFTIPDDLQPGVYEILLRAVDETGNETRTTVFLRVQHGGADEGQAPRIDVGRAFQVPRVFANDNEDIGELHLPVSDPDDDVLTVIANFGSVGRAESADVSGAGDIELLCNESMAIVCMRKGAPDGIGSRWFVLDGISIPPTTLPGTDPYLVEVTAIDAEGHMDTAQVPVLIGGPETLETLQVPPAFLLIVPVSDRELELVLSSPIDAGSVDRGGVQFRIQPALDAFTSLDVRKVSWDTTAQYLYLQTDPLTPGETYVLTVESQNENVRPLSDVRGNRFARDRGGSITFTGFRPPGAAPSIERVKILNPREIEVLFATQVLPSSVHPHLLPSRVSLVSTVTGEEKRVKEGTLQRDGRTLRLKVEEVREGDRYRLSIADVLAPGLLAADTGSVEKTFIAAFPRPGGAETPLILPTADLNRDGRVNFQDFALFSSVYDTEYDLNELERLAEGLPPPVFEEGTPSTPEGGDEREIFPARSAVPAQGPYEDFGGDLPKLKF